MKLLIMVWGMCVTYTRLLLFRRLLNLLWRHLSYRFFNNFITDYSSISLCRQTQLRPHQQPAPQYRPTDGYGPVQVRQTGQDYPSGQRSVRLRSRAQYPRHADMTVEILSCNTGKGANPLEQQLANELNTTVKAPNEYLWFSSNRKLTPMGMKADRSQDTSKPDTMRIFTHQSKK